jgi:hypothetical protein
MNLGSTAVPRKVLRNQAKPDVSCIDLLSMIQLEQLKSEETLQHPKGQSPMALPKVSELTNEQVKAEAAKIVAAKAAQRERMKERGKKQRAFQKELLAVAEKKGLLPKVA